MVFRREPVRWMLTMAALLFAVTGAGAQEAVIEEYPVPRGSRPHDVAPAPDGTVWYTAQRRGELMVRHNDEGRSAVLEPHVRAASTRVLYAPRTPHAPAHRITALSYSTPSARG